MRTKLVVFISDGCNLYLFEFESGCIFKIGSRSAQRFFEETDFNFEIGS